MLYVRSRRPPLGNAYVRVTRAPCTARCVEHFVSMVVHAIVGPGGEQEVSQASMRTGMDRALHADNKDS